MSLADVTSRAFEKKPPVPSDNPVIPPKLVKRAFISGLGISVPSKVVSNYDLEKLVETSHEWIFSRTGIVERRIGDEGVVTSTLCVAAAKKALQEAKLGPSEIDLIIVCTVTPDMALPATASFVQEQLGAKKAAAMDLAAGCTGFIYGLAVGSQFITTGSYQHVLVIGADMLSRVTNWKDRSTCILFGDGAGAVVLSPSQRMDHGILDFYLRSDGSGADFLKVEGGGTRFPATGETVEKGQHYIKMEGKTVYKFAIHAVLDGVKFILERNHLEVGDIDCFVFHQANVRILETAAEHLKIPKEKLITNVEHYGNTSSASVPLALEEARARKKFSSGSYVVLVGFGAGLTWGSALLRW